MGIYTHICALCGQRESELNYGYADILDAQWICPECLEKLRKLIGLEDNAVRW